MLDLHQALITQMVNIKELDQAHRIPLTMLGQHLDHNIPEVNLLEQDLDLTIPFNIKDQIQDHSIPEVNLLEQDLAHSIQFNTPELILLVILYLMLELIQLNMVDHLVEFI